MAILSTGFIGQNVLKAFEKLSLKNIFSHIHFLSIKPLDETSLHVVFQCHNIIMTIEDGCQKKWFWSTNFKF